MSSSRTYPVLEYIHNVNESLLKDSTSIYELNVVNLLNTELSSILWKVLS